ncbi:MAG: hypothetical protein ACRDO1_07080 [Nocardioidaceae bacterium]
MTLQRFEFRDPGLLLSDIAERQPLVEDTALLAVVQEPSTDQRLTHVEVLPVSARVDASVDLSELLRSTMERLPVPEWSRTRSITHAVMTVLVRSGPTIFGANESRWFVGWRYSNHVMDAITGDVLLVTEHGWADFMTDWGGHEPRMQRPRP